MIFLHKNTFEILELSHINAVTGNYVLQSEKYICLFSAEYVAETLEFVGWL